MCWSTFPRELMNGDGKFLCKSAKMMPIIGWHPLAYYGVFWRISGYN